MLYTRKRTIYATAELLVAFLYYICLVISSDEDNQELLICPVSQDQDAHVT
jgi:hypothetical protein